MATSGTDEADETELLDDEADGRVARRERNRDAVVDAIMVLIQAGETQPSMADVAHLAGVSERSIFRHFETRDALFAAVIERQLEVVSAVLHEVPTTGTLADRVAALVEGRARLYEEITPMRRAAVQFADVSELVAERLADSRVWLRDELEAVFARELGRRPVAERRDLLAAVSVSTSWEAWELLRTIEGCSVPRARRITARTVIRQLAGS